MEVNIKNYQLHSKDTGSSKFQIYNFTIKIKSLTEHMKNNHKDNVTKFSLQKLVSKRNKCLKYLKNSNLEMYQEVIKSLNLRK